MLMVFVDTSVACVQDHLRDFVHCEVVPLQTLPSIGDYSDIYTFKNRCMHDICFKVLTTIYVYAFYNADNFISLLFLADCKITEISDHPFAYGLVFGLGKTIGIIGPDSEKEGMKKALADITAKYE